MKPRHFLIVTALSAGLLYCGQLVFPLGIPMGDDFSRAQEDQGSNARPKIKVLPPVSACDGFPSRYPGHAEWPPIIFFCRDAFSCFRSCFGSPLKAAQTNLERRPDYNFSFVKAPCRIGSPSCACKYRAFTGEQFFSRAYERVLLRPIGIMKYSTAFGYVKNKPCTALGELTEIFGEGGVHRFGHDRHMAVIRVVKTDNDLAARFLEGRNLLRREREADELDRRGLAVRIGVFAGRVGFAADLVAGNIDKRAILDAAEPRQNRGAATRIVDLEHDGRDEFTALRDERVVGRQLVRDLRLAALFDVEHLLHLLPHRRKILEVEGRDRPDLDAPLLFQFGDLAAALTAHLDVFVERQDVGAGQLPALRALAGVHAVLVTGWARSPASP